MSNHVHNNEITDEPNGEIGESLPHDQPSFRLNLELAQGQARSTLAIGMAPSLTTLPLEMTRWDDPFLPFGKAVIDATHDLVCAYVFHLGSYLALGAAGAVALERTIAYVPSPVLKIIHAPFANADYVRAMYENGFGANAVTLTTPDRSVVLPYLEDRLHGVFVEAPKGTDLAPIKKLGTEYPDQFGIARPVGDQHVVISMGFMHWYWGDHIFAARGEDFREKIRESADALRIKHVS